MICHQTVVSRCGSVIRSPTEWQTSVQPCIFAATSDFWRRTRRLCKIPLVPAPPLCLLILHIFRISAGYVTTTSPAYLPRHQIFGVEQGGFGNCEVRLYRAYANKQFSKQRSYTPKRYVVFILQMLIYYIYILILKHNTKT